MSALMSDAVMVPREPTEAMLEAIGSAFGRMHSNICYPQASPHERAWAAKEIWSAMLAASTPVEGWEEPDEQDVLDTISDVIGDSMDLDWTYSIGAKAIVEAFKREGWTVSAPPPASVSIDNGSRPQEAVPTEQAAPPVLVPRDQLETLRRSLELGNLLPGEGETLINCWIFASEAESKA